MSKTTYDAALTRLLMHEGGYTNHPSDPGGPTNFGITIIDYRKYVKPGATAADVKAMKLSEAKAIYRAKYWDSQRCDDLPAGVDYAIFDYGVNSGIGRSGKVLRRVMGLADNTSAVNDVVIAAAAKRDPAALARAICDERLAFLQRLKTWPVFGKGWGRRVNEVRAYSLALAAAKPVPSSTSIETAKGKGEVPEPKMAKNAAKAGPVAATAGGATVTDWIFAHPVETGLIALAVIGLTAFALHLINQRRHAAQEVPTPGIAVVPAAA